MPRKTSRIKASADIVRITIILPAADARAIDEEASRRSDEDNYGRKLTRSDVVRLAVHKFVGGVTPRDP